MDDQVFLFVNSFAGKYPILDWVGIFFAEAAVFVLCVISFLIVKKRIVFFVQAFLLVTLVIGVHALIGTFFFRERPFQSHHVTQLIWQPPTMKSFPSDHAGIVFGVATLLFLSNRKWGYVAYSIAAGVALARIFVGVHYPSDVVTGALTGSCIAFGVSVFLQQYL